MIKSSFGKYLKHLRTSKVPMVTQEQLNALLKTQQIILNMPNQIFTQKTEQLIGTVIVIISFGVFM